MNRDIFKNKAGSNIAYRNSFVVLKKYFYVFTIALSFLTITAFAQTNHDLEARFKLAKSFYQAGQFERAESIYRELLSIQNWNYTYFDALNKIFIEQKRYDESIDLIESRIKQNPQDITLYGMLGSTYYMADNIKSAYDSWERGISANPSAVINYRVISNYAVQNRAFDKAVEILERGKKFADDPLIFSLDIANIYSLNMRFEKAAAEYCSLLEIRPDQIEIVKSRIGSYISRQGAAEPTISSIEKFSSKSTQPELLNLLTFIYSLTANYEKALDAAIEYDKKKNTNGNYIFTLAQEAYRNRKYDTASKAYNFFINNYSTSQLTPIAKINLAETLEASYNEKYLTMIDSWKPYSKPKIILRDEFNSIIKAYEKLAVEYRNNSVYEQVIFKMAEVYFNRLFDYKKADSLFAILTDKNSFSNYSILSLISRGKISIHYGLLDEAKLHFQKVINATNIDADKIAESFFYLAKLEFWKGNFSESSTLFKRTIQNLTTDFANDAIEYASLINSSLRDSINLFNYALADLLLFQNKHKEAANKFKTLADNPNLFIINEFANYKFSEMMLAEDEISLAVQTLEKISESSKNPIFSDKSTFLLAITYQYGLKDRQKASEYYQKILEKFPNSLYFDCARDSLNKLQTNNG